MRTVTTWKWLARWAVLAILAAVATGCDGADPGGDVDAGPEASVPDADADADVPDIRDVMVVEADARPDTAWCGENPFPGVDPNAQALTGDPPDLMTPYFSWDGTRIVYTLDASTSPDPGVNYEVYLFEINSWQATSITDLPESDQVNPTIDGDRIIWADGRFRTVSDTVRAELVAYDSATGLETRLTDSPDIKTAPQFNGRYVAYKFIAVGEAASSLRLLDLDTSDDTLLCPVAQASEGVSISDRYVTWAAMPPDAQYYNKDVHIHDLQTGQTIRLDSTAGAATFNTSVWGSKVVWMDFRHGQWDIYLYDIEADQEIRLTDDPFDQTAPIIHGNLVTFADFRFTVGYSGGNCANDIYILDIETMIGRRVTTLPWYWWGRPGENGWLLAALYEELSMSAPTKLYLFDLVAMGILDPTGQHVLPGP